MSRWLVVQREDISEKAKAQAKAKAARLRARARKPKRKKYGTKVIGPVGNRKTVSDFNNSGGPRAGGVITVSVEQHERENALPRMETDSASVFGAVTLDGILATLADSRPVCTRLEQRLGKDLGRKAAAMLKTGTLSGNLGAAIHDELAREILEKAWPVWRSEMFDPDEDADTTFSVEIREYEKIYFVDALGYDPQGYFLSPSDAEEFVFGNWDCVNETS